MSEFENNLLTSNLNQVCVCMQTNILNAEFKWDKIFVTKWKFYERKKNPRNPLSKNKSSYKTLVLT